MSLGITVWNAQDSLIIDDIATYLFIKKKPSRKGDAISVGSEVQ